MKNKSTNLSFPKITKNIKDFINNESGNITTKGALIIGATGVAALGVNEAIALCNQSGGHFNGNTNGHYNGTGTFGASVSSIPSGSCNPDHSWNWSGNANNTNYSFNNGCTQISCNPISGVVNGHYNVTPTCSSSPISHHCNHTSSGDSGDSGDGGDSCG